MTSDKSDPAGTLSWKLSDFLVLSRNKKHVDWKVTDTKIASIVNQAFPESTPSELAMIHASISRKAQSLVRRIGVKNLSRFI